MTLPSRPDSATLIRWTVYGIVGLVAAFAFGVSYIHIYDLVSKYGQHPLAAKAMPLSVDLLIVAATLTGSLQPRGDSGGDKLARWVPRCLMWAGIAATVAANVASGLAYGPVGAIIAGWPGAVFAALVEMVLVSVPRRPESPTETAKQTVITAAQQAVAANSYEAAEIAHAASVAGGNPLSEYQLSKRFMISRAQARKIAPPLVAEPSSVPAAAALNGSGPDGA